MLMKYIVTWIDVNCLVESWVPRVYMAGIKLNVYRICISNIDENSTFSV